MSSPGLYAVAIGAADPYVRARCLAVVESHPHLHVAAVVPNAALAIGAAEGELLAGVIVADESPGLRGRDVLAPIADVAPHTRVVLVVDGSPDLAAPNLAAVVGRDDDDALRSALDGLVRWMDDPSAAGPDQRIRPDRRLRQEWSKVFAERRRGPRRSDEKTQPPETAESPSAAASASSSGSSSQPSGSETTWGPRV